MILRQQIRKAMQTDKMEYHVLSQMYLACNVEAPITKMDEHSSYHG